MLAGMLGAMLLRPAEYTHGAARPRAHAGGDGMSAAARLAGFAAGARRSSSAAPPSRAAPSTVHPGRQPAARRAGGHGDGRRTSTPPQAVRGLGRQRRRPDAAPSPRTDRAARARASTSPSAIVDRRGATVRDFDVEHTKRMHLIVVRRDMTGFQHLHPTQRADGTLDGRRRRCPTPGAYRVFADFSVDGEPHTLAADLAVDGDVRSRPLPAAGRDGRRRRPRRPASPSGATAGARVRARFTVTRDGRPVAVEPYLGARGHLVALREGDLAFLHVHPDARPR